MMKAVAIVAGILISSFIASFVFYVCREVGIDRRIYLHQIFELEWQVQHERDQEKQWMLYSQLREYKKQPYCDWLQVCMGAIYSSTDLLVDILMITAVVIVTIIVLALAGIPLLLINLLLRIASKHKTEDDRH